MNRTPEIREKFDAYAAFLIERNAVVNLTAVVDPDGIRVRHFEDALTLMPVIAGCGTLADVGSGAGFPGVPAAIVRPELKVTLIEATGKKADFLEELIERLALTNARVFRGRAEEAGRDPKLRGRFDAAVARAVAGLPTLIEYCLPLLRAGGTFVAMKGPNLDDLAPAGPALSRIGGALVEVRALELSDGARRNLVVVRKSAPTPAEYPRRNGVPAKDPLLK